MIKMRMPKKLIPNKPNPHKGARLGKGRYEDAVRNSRIANKTQTNDTDQKTI